MHMVKFMFSFLLCIWMPLVLLNLHTLAGDTRDSVRDKSNKSPYSSDHARVPKIHHVVYASHRGSDDRFCRFAAAPFSPSFAYCDKL